MFAVLQRVSMSEVRVRGEIAGSIGPGLLVLLCAVKGDTDRVCEVAFVRQEQKGCESFRCLWTKNGLVRGI